MSPDQVSREELIKSLPLPQTWAETINLKDYWTNQENGLREQAQLEACEGDDEEFEAELDQWEGRRD